MSMNPEMYAKVCESPTPALLAQLRRSSAPGDHDEWGRNLVHYAVMAGRPDLVEFCHEWGCDMSSADRSGTTPLHIASDRQRHDLVTLLLQCGADPNRKDKWGNGPLFKAVFTCDGRDGTCIRLLLDHGADPDSANNAGVSARSLAGTIANYDISKFIT